MPGTVIAISVPHPMNPSAWLRTEILEADTLKLIRVDITLMGPSACALEPTTLAEDAVTTTIDYRPAARI